LQKGASKVLVLFNFEKGLHVVRQLNFGRSGWLSEGLRVAYLLLNLLLV
jgi:hypothetical protein